MIGAEVFFMEDLNCSLVKLVGLVELALKRCMVGNCIEGKSPSAHHKAERQTPVTQPGGRGDLATSG